MPPCAARAPESRSRPSRAELPSLSSARIFSTWSRTAGSAFRASLSLCFVSGTSKTKIVGFGRAAAVPPPHFPTDQGRSAPGPQSQRPLRPPYALAGTGRGPAANLWQGGLRAGASRSSTGLPARPAPARPTKCDRGGRGRRRRRAAGGRLRHHRRCVLPPWESQGDGLV